MARPAKKGSRECSCGGRKSFYAAACAACRKSRASVCHECGRGEPEVEFYRRADGRVIRPCKSCSRPKKAIRTKEYRERHPERAKASMVAWHAKHPEYERERSRRRYATDPAYRARVRESSRAWGVQNPDYYRAAAKLRRARLRGVECSFTVEQARELFEEYAGLCVYCLSPATTLDHVVPISAGGAHAKDNLVPACKSCNSSKRDRSLLVFLASRRREARDAVQ